MDDKKIIKQCQKGDLEQFGLLYDKYIEKIYNFIYFKTHHKETAEDLTSKVFFKALKSIEKFKIGEYSAQAWFYTIARNTVIDHYRTKKDDQNIEDVWDLKSDEDFERDLSVRQKLEKIEKYLQNLKREQREILIMRIWQDMSYSEISDVLGKTESACRMKYSRAINKLRQGMPLELLLYLFFINIFS